MKDLNCPECARVWSYDYILAVWRDITRGPVCGPCRYCGGGYPSERRDTPSSRPTPEVAAQ